MKAYIFVLRKNKEGDWSLSNEHDDVFSRIEDKKYHAAFSGHYRSMLRENGKYQLWIQLTASGFSVDYFDTIDEMRSEIDKYLGFKSSLLDGFGKEHRVL